MGEDKSDPACVKPVRVWAAELSNITKIIKSQLQQLKQERWYHLLWAMRDILFAFNWNINQLLKKPRRRQWDERGNEKGRGMIGMKQRGRGNSEYNSWTVHISSSLLRFSSNAFRYASSSLALNTNTSGIYFSVRYSLRNPMRNSLREHEMSETESCVI